MIRLFVALALPPRTVDALLDLCDGVPGTRWVRHDQLHLTLRFIGEVDRATLEDVVHALGTVEAAAFDLALTGVGHYPPRGMPRVLWAGVRPNPALSLLQSRIESALVRAGLAPEPRKFSAHITLARLNHAPLERVQAFLAYHGLFADPSFPIEAFHLYSSRLGLDGSIYSIEASYPLRGGYDFEFEWDEAEAVAPQRSND
ncbi:MAG: RNA 2',3'-cyclic phosphodiesterase [Alphaproteobacteria bacterium]|nr:RNA 2',3'-cyclic phosphodiesterase [Alphaproteobacteria bacterium]